MNCKYLISCIFVLFLVAACGQNDKTGSETAPEEIVLVTVDGEPITKRMLEQIMTARGVDETDHDSMRELFDEMIRVRAVANAAIAEGLHRDPDFLAERRLREIEALFRRYLDRAVALEPISEEEIRAVYDAQHQRAGTTQYRIETITYASQGEALEQLEAIGSGEFDYAVARDRAEAEGRAIEQPGWIDLSQVPGEFAAQLDGAGAGTTVSVPLPTPQGWRIVRVMDTRPLQAPPLEQVREGIERTIRQQQRREVIDRLYEAADIVPVLPLEPEQAD